MSKEVGGYMWLATVIAWTVGFGSAAPTRADAPAPFFCGADVSMLPEIEQARGVYRDADGKPADAIQILRAHGCNLFRVRLFVKPSTDFNKSYGATQDLPYVRALAKRIKASGAQFLLDLHYSDTWADPGKQFKPAAWKDLSFDDLQKQVHDYTASVLTEFRADGTTPDMVQVGNEITAGMLWPDGKVLNAAKDQEELQWQRFTKLFAAGASAVREFKTAGGKPIRIVLHIHGGGKQGMAKWFLGKFTQNPVDFDVLGLSAYPAWDDSLDALRQNMADAITIYGKEVIVAETSYPWREMPEMKGKTSLHWPMTPQGQKKFLEDLVGICHNAPQGKGIGFIWWYPEAIPVKGLGIWRQGAEALFDQDGKPLPAMDVYSAASMGPAH